MKQENYENTHGKKGKRKNENIYEKNGSYTASRICCMDAVTSRNGCVGCKHQLKLESDME